MNIYELLHRIRMIRLSIKKTPSSCRDGSSHDRWIGKENAMKSPIFPGVPMVFHPFSWFSYGLSSIFLIFLWFLSNLPAFPFFIPFPGFFMDFVWLKAMNCTISRNPPHVRRRRSRACDSWAGSSPTGFRIAPKIALCWYNKELCSYIYIYMYLRI